MAIEREEKIRSFWRQINLLQKLDEKTKDGKKYFLLDGPPYANFTPHVGHIRNTVFKDLYIRWEFMKGKHVLFQPGFDTHGLPIENMVEKKLNLKVKKDIEEYGISKFMKTCKESAALNRDLWMEVYDLLGSWYSWKEPYLTYNNEYIESAWWAFKQLWNKDLVYEGKKPVFWCPKCETALAGYETTDSYKQVTDPAVYVKFKVKGQEDTFLLVYTTTPWTLPANVAIVVAPKETYVKAKTSKGNLILAKERLELIDEEHEILEEFLGEKLDQVEYEPILNLPIQEELSQNAQARRVYVSIPILKERIGSKVAAKKGLDSGDIYEEFVSVKEGTGLVHCAPGHGKTDSELGKHYNLPQLSPLNDQCQFTKDAGKFEGEFVKKADKKIIQELEDTNRMYTHNQITHSYPLCWRCKSPLIFRLSKQWFLKIDPLKEKILEANENVNWQPDFARDRFMNWAANAEDWNFSRQRYWGIPIPIWKTKDGKVFVIESVEELKKYATTEIPDDFDLHTVNEITLKHPQTGEEMQRINDIFDVWYDSGSAPYASLHYPFENKELFDNHFPISRINESQDQIRGWFYHLMFCGIGVFDKSPYETVSMPGWVLDEKGDKMSKSVGNVVWAKEGLEEVGADAIRFYYSWDVTPAQTQKFSMNTIKNDIRRYFSIFRNLCNLVKDTQFSLTEVENLNVKELAKEDQWILSKLNSTIKLVRESIESFEVHVAGRALSTFIMDNLSRTYVQFVRERLDNKEDVAAKIVSYCLLRIAELKAAITPHESEITYLQLKENCAELQEESVHLRELPKPNVNLINEELENLMEHTTDIIGALLANRDQAKVGLRWPLSEGIVDTQEEHVIKAIELFKPQILAQANIKDIKLDQMRVTYDVKPNFKAIGKTFEKETADVVKAIQTNKEEVAKTLSTQKEIKLNEYTILKEHVHLSIIPPKGYAHTATKKANVYLNTEMNESLETQGFVRELSRRIQQLRKDNGMEKKDTIKVVIITKELTQRLQEYTKELQDKIGAQALDIVSESSQTLTHTQSVNIKGNEITLMIEKV